MNKFHAIVGFKTHHLDAHLSGNGVRKIYVVYERQWNNIGDEYTGDMICTIDKAGNILWHKFFSGEFVASKVYELDHLIDKCVEELKLF
jgi:hypothetical protein